MRMNISVPDDLAEQVRARDLPISSICQDALRQALETAERNEKTMSNMQLISVETGEDYDITETFNGVWLVEPDSDETRTGEDNWDYGIYWGVARTQKGQIAVYTAHCNGRSPGHLDVYPSLEQAEGNVPEDILAQAADALGQKRVIHRDI
jgi:hypothetical protein